MAPRVDDSMPWHFAEGRLRAWRVARGDPWHPATDAARWNRAGVAMLYASTTAALAALEALAHLDPEDARREHRLACFCADLAPGDAGVLDAGVLPPDWKRRTGLTRRLGSDWLRSARTGALLVPSALVAGEFNMLLNPGHPAVGRWMLHANGWPWRFDRRLLGTGKL